MLGPTYTTSAGDKPSLVPGDMVCGIQLHRAVSASQNALGSHGLMMKDGPSWAQLHPPCVWQEEGQPLRAGPSDSQRHSLGLHCLGTSHAAPLPRCPSFLPCAPCWPTRLLSSHFTFAGGFPLSLGAAAPRRAQLILQVSLHEKQGEVFRFWKEVTSS